VERDAVNAADVIKEATAAGIRIAIKGSGLSLEAATPPPPATIELIAKYKAEIIDLLRSGRDGLAETRHQPPSLQELVEAHGGYDKITTDAWERFDAEMKLWRQAYARRPTGGR
jgi:hypothetical protein